MSIAEKILARLQTVAEETADLLDIAFSSYHTSYRKLWRSIKHGPKKFDANWAQWYRERQRFYIILSRLKKDGLVTAKKRSGVRGSLWRITQKGRTKLRLLMDRRPNPFLRHSSADKDDKEPHSPALILVIFDIPEREKQKRYWLRGALKRFGFRLLQKSVWLGTRNLPEDFIHALRKQNMLRYVQILAISKRGTIHEVR